MIGAVTLESLMLILTPDKFTFGVNFSALHTFVILSLASATLFDLLVRCHFLLMLSEGLPKNLVRIFLPAITHDSMYGALCTISVPNFSF